MAQCKWPDERIKKKVSEDFFNRLKRCHRKAEPGHEFCIFHIPLVKKRDNPCLAKDFTERFYHIIQEDEADKTGAERDFTGFEFPDGFELKGHDFRPSYERGGPDTTGIKNVEPVNFELCVFGDNVSLTECKFGNQADFTQATFGKQSLFYGRMLDHFEFLYITRRSTLGFFKSIFGDDTVFNEATFGDWAGFSQATFGDRANFENTTFGDRAEFQAARFGRRARFFEATFGHGAEFRGATFGGSADFHLASFGDKADFRGARFGDRTFFIETKFGDRARFTAARFGDQAGFDKAVFRGVAWFNSLGGFEQTNLENVLAKTIEDSQSDKARSEYDRQLTGNLVRPAPPDLSFVDTSFHGPAIFHDDDLSRTLFQQVDMTWLSFLYSQINQTRFIGCTWGRDRRKYFWFLPISRQRFLFDERLTGSVIKRRPVYVSNWRWFFAITDDEWDRIHDEMEKGVPVNFHRINGRLHVRFKWSYDLAWDFQIDRARTRPIDVQSVALQLKQSLENTREPIAAGDFHFANMEMKRLHNVYDPARIGDQRPERTWRLSRTWFQPDRRKRPYLSGHRWRARMLGLYKALNGYGERYIRTAFWILLLIGITTGLYFWLTSIEQATLLSCPKGRACVNVANEFNWWKHLGSCLVYSVQHVLPLKFYGTDLYMLGFKVKAITLAQTIFGTGLFTMFILALRSRFRR
ncbi:MAG: pentapeptide repeat-containing protein [Proteobacteria bacterium]|nr:pentapeptide repeat-containing protein [Pseudomonadota bacterium]